MDTELIYDTYEKRHIKVTRMNIKKGQPGECRTCPIALAITPLINPQYLVRVWNDAIEIYDPHTWTVESTFPVDDEVKSFIKLFDRGAPVNPLSLDVNFPIELWRTEDADKNSAN